MTHASKPGKPPPGKAAAPGAETEGSQASDRAGRDPIVAHSGCPYGCPLDHHEHDWPPLVSRCWYCTALSVPAREGRQTCWDVCPMRQAAAS